MKLCALIPALNEEKAIGEIVRQIKAQGIAPFVVDDGSGDATASVAERSGAVVLRNSRNIGKGGSLVKGFAFLLKQPWDAVFILDGDGQHDPADIPRFLERLGSSSVDMIVGNRMHDPRHMPLARYLTNAFLSWLISLFIQTPIPDSQCGFRLLKRGLVEHLSLRTRNYEVETEMLVKAARLGYTIESVLIKTVYRDEKSQVNPVADTLRFIAFFVREVWISES